MNLTYWNKWQMLSAIAADEKLSVTGKLVAIRLLDHFNIETGQCNPSYQTIAKGLGFSRKRAIAGVQDLEAAGWISVKRASLDEATASGGFERNSFYPAFVRIGLNADPSPIYGTTPRAESGTTPSPESGPTPSPINGTQTNNRTSNSNSPAGGESERLRLFGGSAPSIQKAGRGPTDEEVETALAGIRANYPSRPGPKWSNARKKLSAILQRGVSPDLLAAKAREYRHQCERDRTAPRYVLQPDTWLNQESWTIDYAPVSEKPTAQSPLNLTPDQWAKALSGFQNGRGWPPILGPEPGAPGCKIPAEILRTFRSQSQAAA